MARLGDYLVGGSDGGCKRLAAMLGHEVKCLECPLDRCLYDLIGEEIKSVGERPNGGLGYNRYGDVPLKYT